MIFRRIDAVPAYGGAWIEEKMASGIRIHGDRLRNGGSGWRNRKGFGGVN